MQSAESAFGRGWQEPRPHLAAAPLAEYWPLVPGATWTYDTQSSGPGLGKWEKETISPKQQITQGVKTFRRIGNTSGGAVNVSLEKISAEGVLGLHKQNQVEFVTPIL